MSTAGSPLQLVQVELDHGLEDYDAIAHLAGAAAELKAEAAATVARLAGKTVWLVSSTAQGGVRASFQLRAPPSTTPILHRLGGFFPTERLDRRTQGKVLAC